MTNQDYTEIIAILDRSGSMNEIKTDTEGGFNAFIKDQRDQSGKCTVTLVQFDDRYEPVLSGCPIADVPKLKLEPRGMTALLDAIGRTVVETGQRLSRMPEDERPGRVVVCIMTDGLENASKEWTAERVWATVNHQREVYNWSFVYLGANQDAIKTGEALGVPAASSITYAGPDAQKVWAATSRVMSSMRTGQQNVAYTDDERKLAVSSTSTQ